MTEIIDFSVGMSDPASFPTEELAQAAARAIRDIGSGFAAYPGPYGHPGLRRLMAERETRREGFTFEPEQMALTNGSMQAVTLVARALMKAPGDVIIAEENTYVGTIRAYWGLGAELVGVPVDDQGMQIDALDQTLERLAAEGTKPTFIYTIPTYQNPTAAVMPLERRLALIDAARRYGVLIVEDNCYGDVHFDGEVPKALFTLTEGEGVVYLGSLSKIFAAGVRLGYLVAKSPLLEQIIEKRYDAGNSTLAASVCAAYLEDHLWEHIALQNRALTAKRDALVEALEEHLDDLCTWLEPVGGLFVWLRLPDAIDLDRLEQLGKEHGVGFARGSAFHIHGTEIPCIRLAFGHPTVEEVREGVKRLGHCVRLALASPVAAD